MYAPVTPKRHLISRAAILKNEDWPSLVPTADVREDLGQFPADTEPKAPTPDGTILEQTDLLGCVSWHPEDCKDVVGLLSECVDMFSRHDLDLGETLVLEHKIKLESNLWPFCQRYHPIPQSMYKEVQKHLQEMLMIRTLLSLWASIVVLFQKRDGKLQFYINVHRLNNMTMKDVYSLPRYSRCWSVYVEPSGLYPWT